MEGEPLARALAYGDATRKKEVADGALQAARAACARSFSSESGVWRDARDGLQAISFVQALPMLGMSKRRGQSSWRLSVV